MNRPFSAFATLMTLLALAMFAVSSTSRSTTVKPVARVQGSGFRVQRRAMEVRDEKVGIRSQRSEVGKTQIALKSREKSFVAVTSGAALQPLVTRKSVKRAAMQTTRIVVADNSLASVGNAPVLDYRSHYDSTYDFVVYGVRDVGGRPAVERESAMSSVNLAGELDGIFQELVSRQSKEPLPQAGAMRVNESGIRWKSLAAAIGAWLKYRGGAVEQPPTWQTGLSAPPVGWADYAEFADLVASRNVATDGAAETSGAKKGVRSGDWLRHSAASGLHRLSLILDAAAGELESASGPELSAIGN